MRAVASVTERWRELRQFGLWLLIALSVALCLEAIGADPGKLFDKDGLANAGSILEGFLHPDLSPAFLVRVLQLSGESLLIGILGTVFAVLLGSTLAFFAIRIPDLPIAVFTWMKYNIRNA